MSEIETALLRAGFVAIVSIVAIGLERRTGEIPNLVPLLGFALGGGFAIYMEMAWQALVSTIVVGAPAVWLSLREKLSPDAAKFALALGACMGLIGVGMLLVLGGAWVYALNRKHRALKRSGQPLPRLEAAPKLAAFAGVASLVDGIGMWALGRM
ncbi:MAG: hypothetical protein RMJ84_04635 [Sandaracinaceae bacterium]|nr:hypothetical protein [Sandaracinaceae bacterium]